MDRDFFAGSRTLLRVVLGVILVILFVSGLDDLGSVAGTIRFVGSVLGWLILDASTARS